MSTVLAGADQNALEQLVARHPVRIVAAGAGSVSSRESGTGTPLALLHGIGSGSGSWVHQLEGLAARHRVIAWDAPGYGGSTPLSQESPHAADYAGALASFLDALGVDRLVLASQSLGALMAASFARAHPSRVRGLVLLSPARGYGRAAPELRKQKLDERLAAMAALGPLEHARRRCEHQLGPSASAAARALVFWNMSRLDPSGYAQAARLLANGDIAEDLPRYGGPVLVASGTADRITPEAGCREIASLVSGAEYRSLGVLGHASYAEDPALVNALLAAFVESVPA